jgi:hypothetical protein
LTATSFIIAEKNVIKNRSQEMPANMYVVFVGPPTTGKSPALKEGALEPMANVQTQRQLENCIIEKCTSSALVKTIAKVGKGFIISPEVYEVINKLLKSDEENATGDTQVLCELFSGERSSYRFATESIREIPSNVPFSILGTTQVPYAARLICRMDQGHGLLDRFIFLFPNCIRPSTSKTEEAQQWLQSDAAHHKDIADIFLVMHDLHQTSSFYTFTDEGLELLRELNDSFIQEINEAIEKGNIPPKSKRIDQIQRMAVSLHVFNHTALLLIQGQRAECPPQQVDRNTLDSAIRLIEYAENQKQIVAEVNYKIKKKIQYKNVIIFFYMYTIIFLFYTYKKILYIIMKIHQ